MDHGTLTDNNGRKADFRNTVLVMTTNAGAEQMSRSSIGFVEQDQSTDGMEAVKKMFTPEFRNRLDSIIQFSPLGKEVVRKVVTKFVAELQAQIADRKVRIEIDDAACDWLVERGYDERMGARPMARVIQEHIKKPLAEILLFGSLEKSAGVVTVSVEDGELVVLAESAEAVEA
jgi:ATP-dependent Clp protease ATP-binding subunit ClpA